ncbi:MAG: hypothetical protein ABL897_00490, partial [Hyphomicrobium sp.]
LHAFQASAFNHSAIPPQIARNGAHYNHQRLKRNRTAKVPRMNLLTAIFCAKVRASCMQQGIGLGLDRHAAQPQKRRHIPAFQTIAI